MKRRILSFIVSLVMVLSLLPVQALAAPGKPEDNKKTTITVQDENTTKISDATVIVTRDEEYTVTNLGNGQYQFERDSTDRKVRYTITVSRSGYETTTTTITGRDANTTVVLKEVQEEWVAFNVYYLVAGLPNSYAGAGDEKNYGPSGDNTPMATINVNLTKLKELAESAESGVIYREPGTMSDNQYEFYAKGNPGDANCIEKISNFWEDVKSCMDAESLAAIEATGLGDNFLLYCLKKQRDSSLHADGALYVPPNIATTMYVVELYEKYLSNAENYFWGAVVDGSDPENIKKLPTMYDLLDQYESHLNQNITWEENDDGTPKLEDGTYSGTYIDNGKLYTIRIRQIPITAGSEFSGWEYPFEEMGKGYRVARFEMTVEFTADVTHVVTYTDGVDGEVVFYDHEYSVANNGHSPLFHAIPVREGYTFLGWVQEGGKQLLTSEQVAALTVTGDMIFHAVWQVVPEYAGAVEVILNGTYDSAAHKVTSGEHVDISTVLGYPSDIYVSPIGQTQTYIPLQRTDVGIYSAILENGIYHIYAKNGENYIQLDDQFLTMESADRTRYLFYYSVTYDPNGGALDGSAAERVEYHLNGNAVQVSGTVPEREGYIFLGWQEESVTYQPGTQLTANMEESYLLTALWEEAVDLYVTVVIEHSDGTGVDNADGMHDIAFTVDGRSGDSGDYSELYSHAIDWDGQAADADENYLYAFDTVTRTTTYTSVVPVLNNVQADWVYTATAAKTSYEIKDVTVTDENGGKRITLTLAFDPNNQDLTFRVNLDEAAKQLDPKVWPRAVNVKVNCWYDSPYVDGETVDWNVITQHQEVYQRVELNAEGQGTGTYPVWATDDAGKAYYYRVEVVSFERPDGVVVPAHDANVCTEDPENGRYEFYHAEKHLYDAKVEVGNGGLPGGNTSLTGAYFTAVNQEAGFVQQGDITAIVSIPTFTVYFNLDNGSQEQFKEDYEDIVLTAGSSYARLIEQVFAPDASRYIPQRDGYTFAGWVWQVQNGSTKVEIYPGFFIEIPNYVEIPPMEPGAYLTQDVTLVAQWKQNVTVNGIVTVDATYLQGDSYQKIHEVDRPKGVLVLLQKDDGNGYYETVREMTVRLDYSNTVYYDQGRIVGVGNYTFANVPNDGVYRITVLSPNYSVLYQNEPESTRKPQDYMSEVSTYGSGLFMAIDTDSDSIFTVNAHLEFMPPSFDLTYRVDASKVGEGYRPASAEVLVTYDDGDVTVINPADWAIISQMVFGEENAKYYQGDVIVLPENGENGSSWSVWKTSSDGATLYDYGIRVYDLVDLEGGDWYSTYTHGADNSYFEIAYQAPAHFDIQTGVQSRELVATLVPKTYGITYELNGGTFGTGQYPRSHTWSYETPFDVTPTRSGYAFEGWMIRVGDGETVEWNGTAIPAGMTGNITFYAKWSRVVVNLKVVIDHGAQSEVNTDKDLSAQLTYLVNGDYMPMEPAEYYTQTYGSGVWRTGTGSVDIVERPLIYTFWREPANEYSYSMDVSMDGYSVVPELTVEGTVHQTGVSNTTETVNGTTETVYDVMVCLEYNPAMLNLEFHVEVAGGVEAWRLPSYANVKVTCWDDSGWQIISQHTNNVVRVPMSDGSGTGRYPVAQWREENRSIRCYYRIEVVSLELPDGTFVTLDREIEPNVIYARPGYTATVVTEGCGSPKNLDATDGDTALTGAYGDDQSVQVGTLTAVIDMGKVVFHANNSDWVSEGDGDVFRTYYPAEEAGLVEERGGAASGLYSMAADGCIVPFYDIPEFEYHTHNKYIFKGWYTASEDESGAAMDWYAPHLAQNAEDVHLNAHWIETGTVAKEEDNKNLDTESYLGFEMLGFQIREAKDDRIDHYGDAAPGLRFVAVMSEKVHDALYELSADTELMTNTFEYGLLVASADRVDLVGKEYKDRGEKYEMLYTDTNVNGVNTKALYGNLITNSKCSGVPDHYEGENYRLYTTVITYKNFTNQDDLEEAQRKQIAARAYIRYTDANKLLRTYHNNYDGSNFYSGGSNSYANVRDTMAKKAAQGG